MLFTSVQRAVAIMKLQTRENWELEVLVNQLSHSVSVLIGFDVTSCDKDNCHSQETDSPRG